MACSPIEQGRTIGNPALRDLAARYDASPTRIALAWVLLRDEVCAIPRASNREHAYENRAALEIVLDPDDRVAQDAEFPPPLHAQPLEVL
jgi:diketogulonate reductase-like aldo/keto reductase